jgi:hypothetical protein
MMEPDQLLFDRHIADGRFLVGVMEGMWGLHGYEPGGSTWPFVDIWISAAAKAEAPDRYYFRFQLDGYTAAPPMAMPWDVSKNTDLDGTKWPKGGPVTTSIFKPGYGLYTPFDRRGHGGHPDWPAQYPHYFWRSTFRIEDYLHHLHRTLQSPDYANNP